ncbi:MAG: WYL domain-containing protein [Saprospiraceae bacterium]
MAQNKNALIRYKTIDKCLQNKYRKWTLNDIIDSCSDALYEYEGRDINVSKRTIQLDIQLMRSDKLGYNAPIVVYDKKYYKYDVENYSITNIPLSENDMNILSETVAMLKQFKDFSLFSELGGVIQKLEDKVYTEKTHQSSIIHLEKNDQLRGLDYLEVLYQSILKKICIKITYQSFKARAATTLTIQPYILKEYNNRWFLVGKKNNEKSIITLALDRIQKIDYDLTIDYSASDFDGDTYYNDTIGVTVLNKKGLKPTLLKIDRSNAPYVITKPFHKSQKVIELLPDSSILIEVTVHHNYEFERLILGFGNSIEIIKPIRLRKRFQSILKSALSKYSESQ